MTTKRLFAASTLALALATAPPVGAEAPRMDFAPLKSHAEVAAGRPTISDGERAAASIAIQNLMSRHEFMHAAGRNLEELDNYWVKRDGKFASTATFGSPAWVMYGLDTIRNAYGMGSASDIKAGLEKMAAADPKVKNVPANYGAGAEWVMHTSTTAIIEIAGDGQTAQGAWYSPGVGILPQFEGGKIHLQSLLFFEKYGGDFVKEDGVWKIWHLQMAYDFVPHLPDSMLERLNEQLGDLALGRPLKALVGEAGERPDFALPPGFRKPLYSHPTYSPQRPAVIYPNLPRPYYTFSETFNNCNCEQKLPQPAKESVGQASGQAGSGPPPQGDPKDNPDVTELTAEVDTDGNGQMSRAEWSAQGLPMSSFDMFEKGRGFVTLKDYQENAAPPGIDLNGDGKLTITEFVEFDKQMSAKRGGNPPPPVDQPKP